MKVILTSVSIVLGTVALALSGCGQAPASQSPAKPTPSSAPASSPAAAEKALPATLWLTAAPADAKPVAEVKKSAKAGQDVVIFGRIGGGREPFVMGRALFMLADRSLPSCVEKHGPGCATPWDFCCEPKETVLASTTTIQVVGPDGKPAKLGLDGVHGLKPLAEVVIAGKVSSAGDSVVIDATGIYVKP
jgi:hypothetical protein